MGLFSKKKPKAEMDLPPPPAPPEDGGIRELGDIEPIKAEPTAPIQEVPDEHFEEKPEIMPFEERPSPEVPSPEIPEIPTGMEIREEPEISKFPEPVFEEPEQERIRRPVGPVFVSVDEYRKIIDDSNRVRAKLEEAEEFMQRLNSIKQEEEQIFDKWQSHLETVEKKLSRIDRLLARKR